MACNVMQFINTFGNMLAFAVATQKTRQSKPFMNRKTETLTVQPAAGARLQLLLLRVVLLKHQHQKKQRQHIDIQLPHVCVQCFK